jgi:hypothetical protein
VSVIEPSDAVKGSNGFAQVSAFSALALTLAWLGPVILVHTPYEVQQGIPERRRIKFRSQNRGCNIHNKAEV